MKRCSLVLLLLGVLTTSTCNATKENIVLILTDDQDIELNERLDAPLGPMRHTISMLQGQGAMGTHAYVNVPICCPSRANLLSGKYAHNLRDDHYEPFPPHQDSCGDEPIEAVTGKALPCGCMRMNITSEGPFETTTFANKLSGAGGGGYTTAYFGKYLNPPAMTKYCNDMALAPLSGGWPSGWDIFYGMCDQASTPAGAYYDVTWVDSVAGRTTYTGSEPANYTTSLIGNKTVDFIHAHAGSGGGGSSSSSSSNDGGDHNNDGSSKTVDGNKPFMVVAATRAPHKPYLPPPWYAGTFPSVRSPREIGSWNASTKGKPEWMGRNLPLSDDDADHFDEVMRRRGGALLAVDDMVEGIVNALDETGVLDNTFIFYWSDHGYHLGEFRLAEGKMHFYEFDIRVPFVLRGPGIQAGSTLGHMVGNIDLAPTFLAIAGLPVDPQMDGRSILPLVLGSAFSGDAAANAAAAAASSASKTTAADAAGGGGVDAGCTPTTCNGHGVCLAPTGSECFCNSGYVGASCNACAIGRENYPSCTSIAWRDSFLVEYYPIENYPQKERRLNDGPDNTFRALRFHNDTADWVYAEVTNLQDWFFNNVSFYELYDMRTDPFQLENIYADTSEDTRALLKSRLAGVYGCKGAACP